MAWEQIGTYESIPFWADDSLGLTDQDVLDDHLASIQERKAEIAKRAAAHPDIVATSSEKGVGIDRLRAEVAGLLV